MNASHRSTLCSDDEGCECFVPQQDQHVLLSTRQRITHLCIPPEQVRWCFEEVGTPCPTLDWLHYMKDVVVIERPGKLQVISYFSLDAIHHGSVWLGRAAALEAQYIPPVMVNTKTPINKFTGRSILVDVDEAFGDKQIIAGFISEEINDQNGVNYRFSRKAVTTLLDRGFPVLEVEYEICTKPDMLRRVEEHYDVIWLVYVIGRKRDTLNTSEVFYYKYVYTVSPTAV